MILHNPVLVFWNYRLFIWRSAMSDLRHRYAGSTMGVFWNVLIPLAQILIYTLVFSQIMKIRLPGAGSTVVFAIYLCSGLLPWLGFSECVSRGTQSFLENAHYLKKLPIPEQVFAAQNAVGGTLNIGISMSLLFVLTVVLKGAITLDVVGCSHGDPPVSVLWLWAWVDPGKPERVLPRYRSRAGHPSADVDVVDTHHLRERHSPCPSPGTHGFQSCISVHRFPSGNHCSRAVACPVALGAHDLLGIDGSLIRIHYLAKAQARDPRCDMRRFAFVDEWDSTRWI